MSNSRSDRRRMARAARKLRRMQAAESVAAPAREEALETGTVEAPRGNRPGRMLIQLIKAGWSLNGRYYPAEVLKRDGPSAFPAGTQAFIDHATETEDAERPAGSLRDLAAVMTSPARWDEDRQALVAEVRLFAPWREPLTDMAEHIGMSIRSWVVGEYGEAEGREGFVVKEITEGRSVDFVTKPAAGGAILAVLESVGHPQKAGEARNVGAWIESRLHLALTQLGDDMYGDGRLTREERIVLSQAIGDALRAWAARVEADAPQLFERDLWDEPPTPSETSAEETPAVAAEPPTPPVPVVAQLAAEAVAELAAFDRLLNNTNVPASAGSGQNAGGSSPPTATPKMEGETLMSGTQDGARAPDQAGTADEARNTTTTPVDAAEARVAVLAQERDQYRERAHNLAEALTEARNAQHAAEAERDRAVAEMRRYRANEAGRQAVDRLLAAPESGVPEHMQALIAPRVHDRVLNNVPLDDKGEVDTPALESLVASAIRAERVHAAQLLEAQGVGKVQGLGAEGDPTMAMTAEQFERQAQDLFADLGMDETTIKLAVKGR